MIKYSCIYLILISLISCKSSQSRSPEQRIEFYESKARHYQTLSPPYSITTYKGIRAQGNQRHLRMAYLMEARRYQKLAKEAKEGLNQHSNRSLEVRN